MNKKTYVINGIRFEVEATFNCLSNRLGKGGLKTGQFDITVTVNERGVIESAYNVSINGTYQPATQASTDWFFRRFDRYGGSTRTRYAVNKNGAIGCIDERLQKEIEKKGLVYLSLKPGKGRTLHEPKSIISFDAHFYALRGVLECAVDMDMDLEEYFQEFYGGQYSKSAHESYKLTQQLGALAKVHIEPHLSKGRDICDLLGVMNDLENEGKTESCGIAE